MIGKTREGKMKLSYSQYSCYSLCGEQYRRKYVAKEYSPMTVPIIKGRSVHKVAEKNYGQKITTYRDMKDTDMIMYGVEMFRVEQKAGVELTKEEKGIGKAKVFNSAEQEVIGCTSKYSKAISPRVQPVAVEQYYKIPIAEEIEMVVVIDTITLDGGIRDLKVSKRRYSDKEMQLILYSEVYRRKYGMLPKHTAIDKLHTKNGLYLYEEITGAVTLEDVNVVIRRMNMMIKGIKAEVFMPASPSDWICSPKWCAFFYDCKYSIKDKKSTEEG